MKKFPLLSLLVFLFIYGCNLSDEKKSIEKWKNEILETEQNFAKMAMEEGIDKAFLFYAAEDAVLMRNNKLVNGKNAIRSYFEEQKHNKEVSLTWKPDYVDVAQSGDLGYTYGEYIFTSTDSNGNKVESRGIFHTVWKKGTDGVWRFVWD